MTVYEKEIRKLCEKNEFIKFILEHEKDYTKEQLEGMTYRNVQTIWAWTWWRVRLNYC